mgnify:CR=1 FL=1
MCNAFELFGCKYYLYFQHIETCTDKYCLKHISRSFEEQKRIASDKIDEFLRMNGKSLKLTLILFLQNILLKVIKILQNKNYFI